MKQMGDMKLYTLDEVKDEILGKVGTPRRDEHERKVQEAVYAYKVGEAIKQARLKQNLTQEDLGEKVGVQKSQISRIEKGHGKSIFATRKIFQALGYETATLDLGKGCKIPLW